MYTVQCTVTYYIVLVTQNGLTEVHCNIHHLTIQNNTYSKPQYCPDVSTNIDF